MNSSEQRTHRTVTAALDARVANVETVLEALDARVSEIGAAAGAGIGKERTHRLQLADEQRAYVDQRDGERQRATTQLSVSLLKFRDRGLWGRLRWLVRGT